jgi:hypothetical protein
MQSKYETLENDLLQHDNLAASVIAKKYYSAILVSFCAFKKHYYFIF